MKKKMSFKSFISFKNPLLVSVAIAFFIIGYGAHEGITEPSQPILIQSKEGILCQTCFTPTHHCLPLILEIIQKAQKTIKMQAYSFTSKEIADALVKAHQRGMKIIIIADKSNKVAAHSQVRDLKSQGIEVWFDTAPAIAHNKIIIVDDSIVLTGSYNFTAGAEHRNAENLLLIRSKEVARQYHDNFNRRLRVSKLN
ncbi:MAG: phospholipase D family protein [Alphaproteobacteria bacterium]|nr:phospholipase D family protein [Alphaproteobacteria bacterium]